MEEWLICLLVVYGVFTLGLLIHVLTVDEEAPDPSLPPPKGADASPKDFGFFLFIILWPVVLALGIVIGIPAAIVKQFLYTPGYSCFGMSCVKGPKPAAAGSPTARSNEHNMEAGLAAPAVVTVPPPAAPVEAMEMTPVAKGSDVPEEAPPAYQEDRLNQA